MKKWYVIISLLLLIIASTTGCVIIDTGPTPAPGPSPAPVPAPSPVVKLSIVSHEMIREAGIPRVQAKIKNVGYPEILNHPHILQFLHNHMIKKKYGITICYTKI